MGSSHVHIDSSLGIPYEDVYWAFLSDIIIPENFSTSSNNLPREPEPQPQFHASSVPADQQSKIRKYQAEDWNSQRQEITRLYLHDNATLESVRRIMRERYGLDATRKQYKDRFKIWDINKNIQTKEMNAMITIQQRRELQNKRTAFRVQKRRVNPEKIKRYERDHPTQTFCVEGERNMESGATPSAISYYTPSDTGPLTPHEAPIPHANLDSLPSFQASPGDQPAVHENITSGEIQNPSDAIKLLAQVAAQVENYDSSESEERNGNRIHQQQSRPVPQGHNSNPSESDNFNDYSPVRDGIMSPEIVYQLFASYEESFHPFFPILPQETFDRTRIPWMSQSEPHLFSAILTVASRNHKDEQIYTICYDHMQLLLSKASEGSDVDVEAIETLLILSQWTPHHPRASVGRGEEDRHAWMYIGLALRLGYLLEIDRTSHKSGSHESPVMLNRKRLVWLACCICDSQISVRLGKGSPRAPDALSNLTSCRYPTLQPSAPSGDNSALIFQANLEIYQIFSNVYDILYSSNGSSWRRIQEDHYEKYLDEFRGVARIWNDIWGNMICSVRSRASLLLTYDYLRLYINSFAYQAAVSRVRKYQNHKEHLRNRLFPLISASAPDAKFICEAVDAAKSLLSTLNRLVHSEILCCMPSSYHLFIVHSAVFLYKAESTTTMSNEEHISIRQIINQSIERLQEASAGSNHIGPYYARLLQLLWQNAPKRSDLQDNQHEQSISNAVTASQDHGQSGSQSSHDSIDVTGVENMDNTEPFPAEICSWSGLDACRPFDTLDTMLWHSFPECPVGISWLNLSWLKSF